MEVGGYAGRILNVNLKDQEWRVETLDLKVARKFIGGFGVNNWIAYQLIKPENDSLSPENPIIVGAGPLIGTMAPSTTRVMITTKLPINGAVASGSGSMGFAGMLKWAGYDHVVITGRAEKPVYLKIFDDDIEICDASELWGKDLYDTDDELKKKYHGDCSVIATGQAGENLVRYSFALVDKTATVGRGGLGAVMGSKNLKAMVARGTKGVKVSDHKRFMKTVDSMLDRMKNYPLREFWHQYGFMAAWDVIWNLYGFLYDNWSAAYPPEKANEKFGKERFLELKNRGFACPSCPIGDKDLLEVKSGEFKGLVTPTTSYLNSLFFFLHCEDCDANKAVKALDKISRYGLDIITVGQVLDLFIGLYEKGKITREDTGGLELKRDFKSLMNLIDKIAYREGFGDVLAEGMVQAAKLLEKEDIEKQVVHIKNLSIVFDPRNFSLGSMEFSQVVNPMGAHVACGGSPTYMPGSDPEKFRSHAQRMGQPPEAVNRIFTHPTGLDIGKLTKFGEDWYSVLSSLGICARGHINRFYTINICADFYSSATGYETSPEELIKAGERIWNLQRAINVREGFTRKDDRFPDKWFQPVEGDGKKYQMMDYFRTTVITREIAESFLDSYYDERGWNPETGIPTERKLNELGLKTVADDLKKRKLL
nr:aldehyde ferredoxin oxidoreductase C-terminal domain-containing protein [Candidatus Freyarchaeota archaeon]